MKIHFTSDGEINIEANSIWLNKIRPVINHITYQSCQVKKIQPDKSGFSITYLLPYLNNIEFTVNVHQEESTDRITINYQLEGISPSFSLLSFGISFENIENVRSYLKSGYYSWDGSSFIDVESMNDFEEYEDRNHIGYAMTELIPLRGSQNLVIGFERNEEFQHVFQFNTDKAPFSLTIETLWDEKRISYSSKVISENLLFFESDQVEEGLREWARIVAGKATVSPRISTKAINGWCSWYNLYSYINEEIILDQLKKVKGVVDKQGLPLWVFQIDDGFTPEMGDWLELKPQFPHGIKYIMDQVKSKGLTPGLWIGPLMVGNRSHLYKNHPDWVLADKKTGKPVVQWNHNGEYRWHKRSEEYYILDISHPDAFEYMRQVFHTFHHDWGCDYFKTDFMYFGLDFGPDQVKYHTPGNTRIENWRRFAEMIREEIGDSTWLGSGCPLWPSVGLMDAIRIGHDVGVQWSGNLSAESLLRDLATRNFTNQILWQVDPDCVLLRDNYHDLTDNEVKSLAIYAGMSGGVVLTSDDFEELPPEKMKLWKLILNYEDNGKNQCDFPFLGEANNVYQRIAENRKSAIVHHQSHSVNPVLVQVRRPKNQSNEQKLAAVFIFNIGEYELQRTYKLEDLGFKSPCYLYNWTENKPYQEPQNRISLILPPHSGSLIFLGNKPIIDRPDRLP